MVNCQFIWLVYEEMPKSYEWDEMAQGSNICDVMSYFSYDDEDILI